MYIYADFLQDHTDIIFLKYNHSAELVNTQIENSEQTPIREGAGLWGRQRLSFYSSHCAKLICCMHSHRDVVHPAALPKTFHRIISCNRSVGFVVIF